MIFAIDLNSRSRQSKWTWKRSRPSKTKK